MGYKYFLDAGSIQENSLTQGKTSTLPKRKSGADDFLSSESDKTDYEWYGYNNSQISCILIESLYSV